MSKSTISTFELFALFPDEATAREYLEGRLWPNGPVCPQCGNSALLTRPNGFYRCNPCGKYTFSVREGTIFGRSKIPLHKWIYAMYLLVTARKGISSMQLAKEIGVTQKSAWFMLQRLREACGNDGDLDTNSIESVWAVLKRGLHGVYHHASAKHLSRYVDEFTFRLNEGNVARHSLERLASFVDRVAGKRITYAEVIA